MKFDAKTIETKTGGETTLNLLLFSLASIAAAVTFFTLFDQTQGVNSKFIGSTAVIIIALLAIGLFLYSNDSRRTTRLSRSGQYRITPLLAVNIVASIFSLFVNTLDLSFLLALAALNFIWIGAEWMIDRGQTKGLSNKKTFK